MIERFMHLFRGNPCSYGVFNAQTKKMSTEKSEVGLEQFKGHVEGQVGLGIVPIMPDGECYWGAIDVDAHGQGESIDLVDLEAEIRNQDLPLLTCRSKSGGAHLYLFLSEPAPAKLVRQVLAKWAEQLHHRGAEVFPKQNDLQPGQLGNWINLCYFNAGNTERYCVEGGKSRGFEYFIELAESKKVSAIQLVEKMEGTHGEAPPCVQKMIAGGVPNGLRNKALYNISIYLKQAYPESWKDKAFDMNARIFSSPLEHKEAKKTVSSVARRDYRYQCKEEPCRGLCNSFVCVKRKFGITEEEGGALRLGEQITFSGLKKYMVDPVRWGLEVDGVEIPFNSTDLMDHGKVRVMVLEKLTKMIPPMKNDRWAVELNTLIEKAVLVEAPEEASNKGLIWNQLLVYLQRADLNSEGKDTADRAMLLRGVPVVQDRDGKRFVYFRGSDFVGFLRKNRAEEMRGPNLWFALREHGVEHGPLRIGKQVKQVWYLPVEAVEAFEIEDSAIELEY